MNKSLVTTIIALAIAVLGCVGPLAGDLLRAMGLFAVSGAVTNWLAVHMLFEKVPGLYGSGVIPSRFEEFKRGIRSLIMGQFFTRENMQRLLVAEAGNGSGALDGEAVAAAVDYDHAFESLSDAIMESSFGRMLGMVGGRRALDPLRSPVKQKMRVVVSEVVATDRVRNALAGGVLDGGLERVETLVQGRLDELTPGMVKQIVQEMIRLHLGWLVVWGGVFGALMGLAAALLAP